MTTHWRYVGSPLPYSGVLDERRQRLGERWSQHRFGHDQTGRVTYSYNTLGYRGEEFRSDAPLRIFAFGESNAFGFGVEEHESWPAQVAQRVAVAAGLTRDEVNLVNFAQSGASNAEIARTVVAQVGAVAPDLVLIGVAAPDRTEAAVGQHVFQVGPWVRDDRVREPILALPPGPVRDLWVEGLARAGHYMDFVTEVQCRLDLLRQVLLMQSYLGSRCIPGLALVDATHWPTAKACAHPAVGPLVEQVRADFLQSLPFDAGLDRSVDGQHCGPRCHAALADSLISVLHENGSLAAVRRSVASRRRGYPAAPLARVATVGERVRCFYEAMPFNQHATPREAAATIRAHDLAASYPDLHALLRRGEVREVLELGCGTGWLANTLALHYGVQVTAVDFASSALQRARAVAAELGTGERLRFVLRDLFAYTPERAADLVVSLGVLHHTGNAAAAFGRLLTHARRSGHAFVGLYHEPGRRVFLQMMREVLDRDGEAAALARFLQLDGVRGMDETLARSWFRDQVLHPHETQHTLAEVCGWLDVAGWELLGTSLNGNAPIGEREAVFALEAEFAARSHAANRVQGRFFPGFFTVLARCAGE